MRLAAIMNTHVVFVFTHDSLAVGEDGPTYQPVEHLMSLRSIPGLTVIRPADANETTIAWRMAIERKSPTALILTRQKIGVLDPQKTVGTARGAYVIKESSHKVPQLMIVATGSEVELALKASTELVSNGIDSRVISMPSWEVFDEQSPEYRLEVWPLNVPVVIVEAGITTGWQKYCGIKYRIIGIDRFGTSAPGPVAMDKFGFNVANVVEKAMELVE